MNELKLTSRGVAQILDCIRVWCPLGTTHFCDGSPNYSVGAKNNVRPCEYFVKGKCAEPHILKTKATVSKEGE